MAKVKVKYLGPSDSVNVEPYGPHTKDDAVWNSAFRYVNKALAKAKGEQS